PRAGRKLLPVDWARTWGGRRMPRRKGPEAETEDLAARQARWRYLLRHPEFRAELRELCQRYQDAWLNRHDTREYYDTSHADSLLRAFLAKWPAPGVDMLFMGRPPFLPELNTETVTYYEALFDHGVPPIYPVVGGAFEPPGGHRLGIWVNFAAGYP